MTDLSKATPRPWAVMNCGSDDEPMMDVRAERIRGRGFGHSVAICATGDSPQEMENANAALIVAAVNSYDAHLKCVEALRGVLPNPIWYCDGDSDIYAAYLCEYCGANNTSASDIEHEPDCPAGAAIQALASLPTEGE